MNLCPRFLHMWSKTYCIYYQDTSNLICQKLNSWTYLDYNRVWVPPPALTGQMTLSKLLSHFVFPFTCSWAWRSMKSLRCYLLTCEQASSFAFIPWMLVEDKKNPGSEMKDSLLLTTIVVARVSAFIALIPGILFPTGRGRKGQMASAHGAWLQESNSGFRETAFCSKGRRYISQGPLLICSIKCRVCWL